MKVRNCICMLFVLLSTRTVFAQDNHTIDVFGEYSYLRFNPEFPQLHNRSFNGGGGGFDVNFGPMFAIKAEFIGYGSTSFTTTFATPVTTSHGVIPSGIYSSQGTMSTYLFGPVVKIPISKVTPFGEVLSGGSVSTGYFNLTRSIIAGGGTIAASPTQNAYAMAIGGGLDVNLSFHLAVRPIEIDYLLTRYGNPITSINNQHNFRYLVGVIYRF